MVSAPWTPVLQCVQPHPCCFQYFSFTFTLRGLALCGSCLSFDFALFDECWVSWICKLIFYTKFEGKKETQTLCLTNTSSSILYLKLYSQLSYLVSSAFHPPNTMHNLIRLCFGCDFYLKWPLSQPVINLPISYLLSYKSPVQCLSACDLSPRKPWKCDPPPLWFSPLFQHMKHIIIFLLFSC